jgi:NAD(P)-dependent dehydrogenase (short-subunit alcohol dehydrogenase family)
MSRIWDEELADHGIRILSIDPGDMDTPLHATAVPDADPTTLKRPETAAREIVDRMVLELSRGAGARSLPTPAEAGTRS